MSDQTKQKDHLFYVTYDKNVNKWNIKDNSGKIFGMFSNREIAINRAIKIAAKTKNGRVSLRKEEE